MKLAWKKKLSQGNKFGNNELDHINKLKNNELDHINELKNNELDQGNDLEKWAWYLEMAKQVELVKSTCITRIFWWGVGVGKRAGPTRLARSAMDYF